MDEILQQKINIAQEARKGFKEAGDKVIDALIEGTWSKADSDAYLAALNAIIVADNEAVMEYLKNPRHP